MKHSPGPWVIVPENAADGSRAIAQINPKEGPIIAYLPLCIMTKADIDANARLIAAAPELLEALKLARADLITCSMIFQAMNKEKGTVSPVSEELRGKIRSLDVIIIKAQGDKS